MEARATLGRTQIAAGVVRWFIVALLVAFLVGGAGGYIVRALTASVSTTTTTDTPRPFVVESPPYSTPAVSPMPMPTVDPAGYPVPI